jgi:hypothetical protein
MDLISFVIGYAIGFISPIIAVIVYGRKQIKAALEPYKVK